MARVERRQRHQRREGKESKEEVVEMIGVSQDSSWQVEEVLGTVSAAQAMTEASSATEHDKVESLTITHNTWFSICLHPGPYFRSSSV